MPRFPIQFWGLFGTDLIVRTAYQIGKTPLLPLFAAAIGASEFLIGLIVAVSTATGMVLKPIFGVLSDRWGRRIWLFAGVAVFIGAPFLYTFVQTPNGLLALRLFHGLATAIFGPVTLAYVIEMRIHDLAPRLAWFGIAREGGYLLAPAIAGWLLMTHSPETIFTLIGLASCFALIPLVLVNETESRKVARATGPSLWSYFKQAGRDAVTRAEVWVAGCIEMGLYVATYALKAFLPLFIIKEAGLGVLTAGLFFTVQEAAHLLARPAGGWYAQKAGLSTAISSGLLLLAAGIALVHSCTVPAALFAIAVLTGIAQGVVLPATIALVGGAVSPDHLGAGMGVFGTLRNVGKIAGPAVVGGLLEFISFALVFGGLAAVLTAVACSLLLRGRFIGRTRAQPG